MTKYKVKFLPGNKEVEVAEGITLLEAAEKAVAIAKKTTNIKLSNYLPFMDEFMAALFLPHTDTSLFSSVHYWWAIAVLWRKN